MATSPGVPSTSSSTVRHNNVFRSTEEALLAFHNLPSDSEDDFSDNTEDDIWHPKTVRQSPLKNKTHQTLPCSEISDDSEHEDIDDLVFPQNTTVPKPSAKGQRLKHHHKKGTSQKTHEAWIPDKDNNCNEPLKFLGMENCNVSGEEPIDFFSALVPDDFLQIVVDQSNLYAVQNGKENLSLTLGELKVFLGINFVMTYLRYTRLRQYWSAMYGMRLSIVADSMSYQRFCTIRKYIHFADNSVQTDSSDRLYKLRPFIEHLRTSFKAAISPGEFLSLDEMMVPFKGASSLKQYMKNKPHRWGYKIWVLATSSGYVLDFEIYQGKGHGQATPSEFGVVGDLVLRLTESVKDRCHKLFFDNLFTSIPLLLKLKELNIFATGTIRINRMKDAAQKLAPVNELKKKDRGVHSKVTTQNSNITVLRWCDNSVVHVASTFAGEKPMTTIGRWSKKEGCRIKIPLPYAIQVYNRHMGGVDTMDSLIGLYRHTIKDKRWYMRIVNHMLQVVVVNAWLLWRMCPENQTMDLLEFKSSVAASLIFQGLSKHTKRGRPTSSNGQSPAVKRRVVVKAPNELRLDGGNHFPTKTEGKYAALCHLRECKRKTRYKCKRCNEPLCPECFEAFHTRN